MKRIMLKSARWRWERMPVRKLGWERGESQILYE